MLLLSYGSTPLISKECDGPFGRWESKLQILLTCFTDLVNTADVDCSTGSVRRAPDALAYWITQGAGRRTVRPPTVGSTA